MTPEHPDTDARMREALAAYLPDEEPPVGLRVEHVMRLGRRRHRIRRVTPIAAAAVVAALAAAVPWLLGTGEPDRLPTGGTTSLSRGPEPSRPPATSSAAPPSRPDPNGSATATAEGPEAPAGPKFRVPPGHVRAEEADTLAKSIADRQPAGTIAAHFGTRSAEPAGAERYGYGFHLLWRDAGRYGYLAYLHRTKGEYPASVYGMPAEPCLTAATRKPEYHCAPVAVPDGDVAWSYEIDTGYRVRGVVWDKQDPEGTIRITGAFCLPSPGAWTPFSALDDGPGLTSIPVTTADLADMIGIP